MRSSCPRSTFRGWSTRPSPSCSSATTRSTRGTSSSPKACACRPAPPDELPASPSHALADRRRGPRATTSRPDERRVLRRGPSVLATALRAHGRVVGLIAIEHRPRPLHGRRRRASSPASRRARARGRQRPLVPAPAPLGAEAERARIARDLHDNVAQSLAYAGFELERLAVGARRRPGAQRPARRRPRHRRRAPRDALPAPGGRERGPGPRRRRQASTSRAGRRTHRPRTDSRRRPAGATCRTRSSRSSGGCCRRRSRTSSNTPKRPTHGSPEDW